jgi:hypothetical protein
VGYRGGFEHVDLRANVLKIVTFCFSVKGLARRAAPII